MKTKTTKAIKVTVTVYIDGECNLCDRLAHFLHRRSEPNQFRFDLLQDNPNLLPSDHSPDTLVVEVNGEMYTRDKAVLLLMARMRQPYPKIGRVLKIFPSPVIEILYRVIAYSRYRIWGRRLCSLRSELKD